MNDLNKVLISGNLARDPESRDVAGNLRVCELRLAVNRRYKDRQGTAKEDVCFLDAECLFSQQESNPADTLRKGAAVFIEGRLKLDQWDDKQSGQHRSRLKVVAERILPLAPPCHNHGRESERAPAQNDTDRAETVPRPVNAGRLESFSGRRHAA
ncbi:MAG: single-stranded DNA-binding protein [bacterium]